MASEELDPVTFDGRFLEDALDDSQVKAVACRYSEDKKQITFRPREEQGNNDIESEPETVIQDDQIICMQSASANDQEWNLYYAQTTPKPNHVADEDYHVERNTHLKRLLVVSPPSNLLDKYTLKPTSPLLSTPLIRPIVSLLSGGQHADSVFKNLLSPFLVLVARHGGQNPQEPVRTSSSNSITEFAEGSLLEAAQRSEKQLVILLSGDGGIVDIVNALADAPVPVPLTVALVPCGTGNALANSTSAASLAGPTLGLRTLALGSAYPLPLLEATFDPPASVYDSSSAPSTTAERSKDKPQQLVSRVHAAVVISWGLHAALVADSDTPEYRKHGAARFGLAAHENLFPSDGSPSHAYQGRLSLEPNVDDDDNAGNDASQSSLEAVPRQDHAYVLATLVARLEKSFTVSPASQPLDGRLRVVHFAPPPDGGQGVMRLMMAAYKNGEHVRDPQVGYAAASRMRLELKETQERWRRVCVDGTIYVAAESGRIDIIVASGGPVLELVHVKE